MCQNQRILPNRSSKGLESLRAELQINGREF